MKKLSDVDYNQLKNDYKQKALEILHEEDEENLETETMHVRSGDFTEQDMEKEVEKELAQLRRQQESNE